MDDLCGIGLLRAMGKAGLVDGMEKAKARASRALRKGQDIWGLQIG